MNAILILRGRAKAYGVLPVAGGLFDQDEATMELLDIVEHVFIEVQKKMQGDAVAEVEREKMMRKL